MYYKIIVLHLSTKSNSYPQKCITKYVDKFIYAQVIHNGNVYKYAIAFYFGFILELNTMNDKIIM